MNNIITDIRPIAIITMAVVLYLFGIRNCSLIAISFYYFLPNYFLAVAVLSVFLATVESVVAVGCGGGLACRVRAGWRARA